MLLSTCHTKAGLELFSCCFTFLCNKHQRYLLFCLEN
uniref:Uncharacterized protein n=1 Tax=Rhizophora mucronata TaxID=61149 RepID=A0A2P2NC99_RHIMU